MRRARLSKNDLWLGIVSFLNDLSSEMIFPVLPFFLALVLGFSKGTIGVIEGAGLAAVSLFQGFSGYWSDRMGRRKPLVVAGYAISTLTKPFFAVASSVAAIFALRFLDRASKGVRNAPRDALISDTTVPEARGRAYGFNRAMDTAGAIVGTFIVFLILRRFVEVPESAYRTIFWISFFPGALAVIALMAFVRDVRVKGKDGGPLRQFQWRKVSKHAKFFFVVATVFALANASYAFFLLRATSVGMPVRYMPLLYIVWSIFSAALAVPIGQWSDKQGRAKALMVGYLVFALTAYSFTLGEAKLMWLLFALYGIAMALTEGVSRALVADLVHHEVRGTAFGIYHTATGAGAFVASVVFGVLWDRVGETAPFLVSSILSLLAAALFGIFLFKHRGHGHFGGASHR